ncbi:MAG: phytanoyl-CoA dioxygenase family protein, partial [Rivularia sp. (in: cyanobacteria)]
IKTKRRCYVGSLSREEKKHPLKINDLYLNYDKVRSLSLNENLVDILSELLLDKPVLCNTLSLHNGTQQFLHVDSLYMTPLTDEHLAATWIALEDCHPDAGPLVYVPGSHKIPIYRFSTGSAHQVNEEFPRWQEYIEENVHKHGLKEEVFLPKKGDVFIWHAQLLHGGSPINNPHLTRKSIVSHYFTESDCKQLGSKLVPNRGGYWMDRPPQEVVEVNENKITSRQLIKLRIEHILRTTLHYFRLWKRDVLKF